MAKHSDVGQRVRWTEGDRYGYGKLMAVNVNLPGTPRAHLIQGTEYADRWGLVADHKEPWHLEVRKQGVRNGTDDLFWVDGYSLLDTTEVVSDHINRRRLEEMRAYSVYCGTEEGVRMVLDEIVLRGGELHLPLHNLLAEWRRGGRFVEESSNEGRWSVYISPDLNLEDITFQEWKDKFITNYNHNQNNMASNTPENAVEFVRNEKLNADDRLLRELFLENSCGEATNDGYALSRELTYQANRPAIIALAKKMKKAQECKKSK